MKTSPEDTTILLVGGGGIVAPAQLSGVAEIIRPPFFDVANAVGAAMAKGEIFCSWSPRTSLKHSLVAGEVDTIEFLQGRDIHDVIDAIKLQASLKAKSAGADPGLFHSFSRPWCLVFVDVLFVPTATVKIVEVTNLPVQVCCNYSPSIRVLTIFLVCY